MSPKVNPAAKFCRRHANHAPWPVFRGGAGALESWRRVIRNFGVAPGAETGGNSAPDFCTTKPIDMKA
jgi:hypothetical protein